MVRFFVSPLLSVGSLVLVLKVPERRQLQATIFETPRRCDSCAQGALGKGRHRRELVRCGIASECYGKTLPLSPELSELFCPHRALGRELSEFLSAYYLCAKANSPSFFSDSSPSLPQDSVSSLSSEKYSRNSIPSISYRTWRTRSPHPQGLQAAAKYRLLIVNGQDHMQVSAVRGGKKNIRETKDMVTRVYG